MDKRFWHGEFYGKLILLKPHQTVLLPNQKKKPGRSETLHQWLIFLILKQLHKKSRKIVNILISIKVTKQKKTIILFNPAHI